MFIHPLEVVLDQLKFEARMIIQIVQPCRMEDLQRTMPQK